MLKKKQYWLSLLMGVGVFFLFFGLAYWYMASQLKVEQKEIDQEASIQVMASPMVEEVKLCIQPQTKVTLMLMNAQHKLQEKIDLEVSSVLGWSEEEVQESFEGYEITRFDAKEVVMVKYAEAEELSEEADSNYLLIDEDGRLCIENLKTREKVYIEFDDLSSDEWTFLSTNKIRISDEMKAKIMIDPSTLQKLLQHD